MDKKPLAVGITILLFLVSFIPSTAQDTKNTILTSNGKWWYVGGSGSGNYTMIQDAIDNTTDGDTVFVYSGVYYETIDINKSIIVFGQDKETTIIEGNQSDHIVNISVDFVNFGGFSVISDWQDGVFVGIYVQANDTIIKDNIIKTDEADIVLYNSSNSAVIHNFILNTNCGVALMQSHYNNVSSNTFTNTNLGIELSLSNYNTIALNNLSSNRYYGLYLNTHCNFNAIFQNTISKIGWDGIEVDYSDNNFIGDNNIFSINDTGIRISGDSDNNALYHNNFWDNGVMHMTMGIISGIMGIHQVEITGMITPELIRIEMV